MNTIDATTLRLSAVVESSEDAVISQALDGTIETWNRAAERMFGYSRDEAIGRSIDFIIPADRRRDEQQITARVRRGESVSHFESGALTRDGVILPISLSISPVLTPGGTMIGFSRIARDLSRERALEHEAFRLAAIVDSSEDAIISKDLNGVVQTWNKGAERMFGYGSEEMVGRPITTIIPPERLAEADTVMDRVRAGAGLSHFETVRRRKNGTIIDVSLSLSPIKTPDGEIIAVSSIARDITSQKALERDAFRLSAIVESSEDAIASKDLNGIVQTWNRAAERMFGYTAEEMIGRSIMAIIPADRQQEEADVLARIRAGLSIKHFETIRQRKDGTLIEISLSVSPIRSSSGHLVGASKIARDITAQRQLMREVEEANRVKDEFLAMLSHELRTPLNAVIGYTHMLRSGQFAAEQQEQAIETIERNANTLSHLVSDILDVSSIVTGKIQLKPALCDIRTVVAAAVDVVRPSAQAKGVALEVDLSDTPLRGLCDSDRLQQVLWNLLSNAVKFTPSAGSIRVTAEVENRHARLTVTDTGAGIRPESLPYVFQRFWQGESARKGQIRGLGLGLALARHFVELHGGTIAAYSEGEGRGATFTVRLPLLDERALLM